VAERLTAPARSAARHDAAEAGVEEVEIRLLIEGIRLCYGYDFREYALRPLRRSISAAMASERTPTVSAYQDRILHDPACMKRFLARAGVSVTGMFRDPAQMRCLRDEVVPHLRTYPSVRIWMVGCATGEEVCALAIILREEGILHRARIYATDLNEDTLVIARTGAYSLERIRSYEAGYLEAGGRARFKDYYTSHGSTARFDRSLLGNVTWTRHDLVGDASFNEFHLIICANVLIYFGPSLQARTHRLLDDSLMRSGFLALGKHEALPIAERDRYRQVREGVSLWRKAAR
jgi:chemotaxis protein methyltransferase CheR